MAEILHMSCDFCGKARNEVEKLIVANEASICNECIELCHNILDTERNDRIKTDKKLTRVLDPVKITKFLDQYIVGQKKAKQLLAVSVVNHYKRLHFKSRTELEKSNLLMFGPTGSGKTMLAKFVARYLNVPFVIADATTLTQAGYVGDDVDSLVSRLLAEADNDVQRCQQGIIFIDEIDKIGRKSESASLTRDVSGEGVQQSLLKVVEGTKIRINSTGNKKSNSDTVEIDTSNILFIAGGAFEGLQQIIEKRTQGSSIGFVTHAQIKTQASAMPEDFIKYGMIPEFVGRFPITVELEKLGLESLTRILLEPKNSLLDQMQFYFQADGIELEFDDSALLAVAQRAVDLDIGARGLRAILEQVMMPLMYNIGELKKQNQTKLTITEQMIITSTATEEYET
jgi:ATP-dependent Clp protease ATP-binding subunit ClpX